MECMIIALVESSIKYCTICKLSTSSQPKSSFIISIVAPAAPTTYWECDGSISSFSGHISVHYKHLAKRLMQVARLHKVNNNIVLCAAESQRKNAVRLSLHNAHGIWVSTIWHSTLPLVSFEFLYNQTFFSQWISRWKHQKATKLDALGLLVLMEPP